MHRKAEDRERANASVWVNIAILGLALLMYALLASPRSVASMTGKSAPKYRGASRDSISLQCVVGWNASALGGILDTLKEKGVNITFAVGGEWARRNPDMLRRIAEEGHGIAVTVSNSAGEIEGQLKDALGIVESVTGVRPSVCCCVGGPPQEIAKAAVSLGLDAVLCTADLDCAGADAGLILKRLANCAEAGYMIDVQPTRSLMEALPEIINYLKNVGLAIVPTHKMLYN